MTLVLFPGAGSDANHSSQRAIEAAVAPHRCVRADFPYRLAGRRAPDRAPVLMAAVREVIAAQPEGEPLVLGGRSMGGRMCSMVAGGADGLPAPADLRGLVLISYPLHPPGKPDRLRVDHLPDVRVPTLFVSGTRDTFGTPDELTRWSATMPAAARVAHAWLDGKGHDLARCDESVAEIVAEFVSRVAGRARQRPRG